MEEKIGFKSDLSFSDFTCAGHRVEIQTQFVFYEVCDDNDFVSKLLNACEHNNICYKKRF